MSARQLDHAEYRGSSSQLPLRVLAHQLERPENLGSLFRLADAFGVAHLDLTGSSVDSSHPKVHRAARSTVREVPHRSSEDPIPVIQRLRDEGWFVAAVEVTTDSQNIKNLGRRPPKPICLVLGSERHGVPDSLLERCDGSFHIPMLGQNSSLNVATAAAIALYEAAQPWLNDGSGERS